MKSLTQYINEGIFDDNVATTNLKIHDVEIKPDIWSVCEKYFSLIKKDLKGKKEYQDPWNKNVYNIAYFGNDCIILTDTLVSYDSWMYVVCTEAIYMNYMALRASGEWGDDEISLKRLQDYGHGFDESYLNLSFAARISKYAEEWYPLEGCDKVADEKAVLNAGLPIRAYCPETISHKAQKIINDYMK